ncbi:MAG: hypothetical protein ABS917_11265 [Solibacillus sp.]|uniref:hypothetical protein n=1 Tax=Solibacillus sp. TaxID=1909654 RepID=UPI0033153DF1
MNFAEDLRAKADAAAISYAYEFLEKMKLLMESYAEKGCKTLYYKIDMYRDDEKARLKLYRNPLFVKRLNEKLDGVKVTFIEENKRGLMGNYYKEYFICFDWS